MVHSRFFARIIKQLKLKIVEYDELARRCFARCPSLRLLAAFAIPRLILKRRRSGIMYIR